MGPGQWGVAGGSRPQILYFKLLILRTFLMFSSATPCYPHDHGWPTAEYANLVDETLPSLAIAARCPNIDQWLIVSLIYPPKQPSEPSRQGSLFDA
jgi:hypothetical protein